MSPLSSLTSGPPPTRERDALGGRMPHGWHWYVPRVALGLFVCALLALLLIQHRREQEEDRTAVIRDLLWVEQNAQFSFGRDVEQLRQLAEDAPGGILDQRHVEVTARHLLPNSPLTGIVVLDAGGSLVASAPPQPRGEPGDPWLTSVLEPAYRLAQATGKPTYGPPVHVADDHEFLVFVPFHRGGAVAGTVVGIYALKPLLRDLVPWWLAEKHRVTLRDANGNVLAAKSNVEAPVAPELTHQIPLDPPGHDLLLRVDSYGSDTRLLPNLLVATIVVLAVVVLWSLWVLRRQMQRRLATEEELRAEHAFRKSMEDSLETGMRAEDLDGRLVYVNPAFCKMVGFSEAELLGRERPRPYWPPEEHDRIRATLQAARAAGTPRLGVEMRLMRRNGERFDALLYESALIDANGQQTGWMASLLDITERKRARERARQQEEKLAATARLVTMGEMASAIAHELNQPLSAIASYTTGSLNVLRSGSASPALLEDALQKAAVQAQRAGRIIRRVYDFVRKSEPTRIRVRINGVVEEALGFAETEARKRGVRIVPDLTPVDPGLDADPLLLQQVLLNLLRNAMDAMAATPPDRREIHVRTDAAAGDVTVAVADRGAGIDARVREQLFEPFFTTKPEGMGMGLNICRSILELHGGRVWADPNPGGGTVFSFSIPCTQAAAPARESA